MPGGQSRGLVQASITKGWDPRKIPAGPNGPAVDLSKIDVDPGNLPGPYLGRLSDAGPKADAPDGYDSSIGSPSVPFEHPDTSRETANRRTSGANPYPAKPGTG